MHSSPACSVGEGADLATDVILFSSGNPVKKALLLFTSAKISQFI
jgi:hypothetical protein